jgi:CarD family transcriptional regulator
VAGFRIGDKVVYPHHGAATIEKIEKRELFGEERDYYILKLAYGELTLMVPTDSTDEVGLREVTPEKELPKVMKVLKKNEPTTNTTNWSRRFKANVEKLKSGDIYRWQTWSEAFTSATKRRAWRQARSVC